MRYKSRSVQYFAKAYLCSPRFLQHGCKVGLLGFQLSLVGLGSFLQLCLCLLLCSMRTLHLATHMLCL